MNWADSSDDESDDELHPARLANESQGNKADLEHGISYDDDSQPDDIESLTAADSNLELAEDTNPFPPEIDLENLPENFPTEAPYTAYVRNVAFNIKNPEDFAEKIEGVVNYRYQNAKKVKVTTARLGFDHQTGKRKGFGYAEFDTAEELLIFLNISDGFSNINGRSIGIDVATSRRRNNNRRDGRNNDNRRGDRNRRENPSDIDGSQFRGGIRKSSSSDNRNNSFSGRAVNGERPSLKLAPRTKPSTENDTTGKSDIFGKARPVDNDRGDSWRSDRGGRGRGGRGSDNRRGGGRGGRKGGRNDGRHGGRGDGAKKSEKSSDGWGSAKGGAKPTVAAPPVVETKKSVTKVVNSFAGLAFDSDSD